MLVVHGEVAPRRYLGHSKDFGSQYVRGIPEKEGDPPGNDVPCSGAPPGFAVSITVS